MKLLLLQPPIQDFYDTDIRIQPVGLGYLKAAVKKYLPDIQVVIKDYHQGWGRRTISLPDEFNYLKEYYAWPDESPFSTFHNYFHFGAAFDTIAEDVSGEKPHLVGISSLFSPYHREVLKTATALKKRLNVPMVVGGSHVSAMPLSILKQAPVDFVIWGEGERPLVELLKAWNHGKEFSRVPNLGYKQEGKIFLNESQDNYPLDQLPPYDLSDLEPQRYLFDNRPMCFVITSRGCPYRCTFCSVHDTFGFEFRSRPAEEVLEEVKKRYAEGIRVFDFEDDNLTYHKEGIKSLCRYFIKAFPSKDIQLVAMNGISYHDMDPELLELMREAGFTHLNISLVSSDIHVRKTAKRPHTIEKYLEVVQTAARLGFKIVSYQILGLPNESLNSMIQTLVLAARLPVLLGASLFYLTPNSPIAENYGDLTEEDVFKARLTAMAVETEGFKRDDLYTLFITARILNFLKGIRFEQTAAELDEALQIARSGDKRSQIGAELLEKLLKGKRLYAATKNGLKPLPRFKFETFWSAWKQLNEVGTQQGNIIRIQN
ncbi:MAG: B12-binding domain-containing radical SAM protein [Candidatus Omnitrophica bacterium]|nr:B12-binding domain-containing radical SAM protein [Candidatus Omnitrophota bacterium]